MTAGEPEAAARLVRAHLERIWSEIDLDTPPATPSDLKTVYG